MWFILLSLAIVALTCLIYNQYTFWSRNGVPGDKHLIPFGSLKETVFGKKATGLVIHNIYKHHKEPFVGVYMLFQPALLIRDVELVRNVLVQDFNSFHDRGTGTKVTIELFSMRGASWKTLRAKLTPLFSTGKLKSILTSVNEVGDRMLNHINTQLVESKYPGLPFLNRECTQDYKIPNSDYTVKKGTSVIISVLGLHYDPENFPDPMKFDPPRFSEEQHNYNADAYMPFGEGPRPCIARRMCSINSKIAVIKVLANFNIAPKEHKEIEIDFSPGVAFIPKGGLQMKLTKKIK
ncbi:cytochrome P450 6d3-like [Eurosta solidaginis]|uniref:cytochrome P450 6d3-like n=1 Tax=Eurosta solidaginis TaxID=178769 RepID=UPI0035315659